MIFIIVCISWNNKSVFNVPRVSFRFESDLEKQTYEVHSCVFSVSCSLVLSTVFYHTQIQKLMLT